jgi:hypothetical protein
VVVVIGTSEGEGRERILGLLGMLSEESLLEAIGAVTAEPGGSGPPLAAAVLDGERRVFVAHAGGVVVAHADGQEHRVDLGPGERLGALPRSAEQIRLTIGSVRAPIAGTDLVEGIVIGGGVLATVTPLEPPPAPAKLDVISLAADSAPPESLVGLEPLPVGAPSADDEESKAAEIDDDSIFVPGVRCPRDHHNSPGARFCHRCGIRMGAHRSLVIVEGPRPPLGVLVLDDGDTFALVSDAIIGREPTGRHRPEWRGGTVHDRRSGAPRLARPRASHAGRLGGDSGGPGVGQRHVGTDGRGVLAPARARPAARAPVGDPP